MSNGLSANAMTKHLRAALAPFQGRTVTSETVEEIATAFVKEASKPVRKPTVRDLFEHNPPRMPDSQFMLVFCAPGNPDRRQHGPVAPPELSFYKFRGGPLVGSAAAERMARDVAKYIEANDLGGGNWVWDAGKIFDVEAGIVTHQVAYNGTIRPIAPEHLESAQELAPLEETGLGRFLPEDL